MLQAAFCLRNGHDKVRNFLDSSFIREVLKITANNQGSLWCFSSESVPFGLKKQSSGICTLHFHKDSLSRTYCWIYPKNRNAFL